jgi:1-acylglycerone phosphate reductase
MSLSSHLIYLFPHAFISPLLHSTPIPRSSPTPFNGVYCAAKAALHSLNETLSMELQPFNIRTLLVIPASVKSNIAQNHSKLFMLPPNSLYKSYLDRIVARMWASQSEGGTMDTAEFARRVVDKAINKNPPMYLMTGGLLLRWYLLALLPRWLQLKVIWKKVAGK